LLVFVLLLFSLAPVRVDAQSSRAAGAYTNPVFTPTFADPSVFKDPNSSMYYAYGTTDQWGSDPSTTHIMPILQSPDLVHWTFVHDTFSPSGSTPSAAENPQPAWTGSFGLWAPEVHFFDGHYVMYYTASNTVAGGSAIGVATAPTATGPWTDSGGPLEGPRPDGGGGYYWTFDPNEIQAPSGQRYLYFGSFYGGTFVVKLTADGLHADTSMSPVQVGISGRFEGTYVLYRDGYYYMFASSGNCCAGPNTGYTTFVGRSASPLGPFVDQLGIPMSQGGGLLVLAPNGNHWMGTGGVSIVQDAAGQDWLAFHAVDQNDPYLPVGATRRPMLFEPIEWTADGWPEVNCGAGAIDGPQPVPVTGSTSGSGSALPGMRRGSCPGAAHPPFTGAQPLRAYSDEFNSATLGPQWSWIRENPANWSLNPSAGTLTIVATGGDLYQTVNTAQNILVENAPPADFMAETKVQFNPTQNYEQAGLLLYQNDDTYLRLVGEFNSQGDETEWAKETLVTSSYTNFNCGSAYPANTCPIYGSGFLEVPGFSPAAKAVGGSGVWTWLRIVKRGDLVTAYTSIDGRTWLQGATYNLSGFSQTGSLKIGLMAITPVANTVKPAQFDYVRVYALHGDMRP
jgi:arabinan endo-1,5-alpha-L-arabinosidase